MAHKNPVLPVQVATPSELGRLMHELEAIDTELMQLGIRKGGKEVKMPQTSKLMDEIIEQNKLNLLHEEDRKALKTFLTALKDRAPVLHMSFSQDPPAAFMAKLVTWLRQEIDPFVLVTVGLEPNIGAGCIVRSTNKQFDFSLQQDFAKKRDVLITKLTGRAPQAAPEAAA